MSPEQQLILENWLMGAKFGSLVVLGLFFLLQVKHLVVDFFLQNKFPYMWMNKHKFFHPGGWLHAGSHAVASFGIFAALQSSSTWIQMALFICGVELVAHFLIDLVKMRIGIRTGWKCNTHPQFWNLLGVDQFLHQLTYIWMVAVWVF